MTTNGTTNVHRNGLQDERQKPISCGNVSDKLPQGLVPSKKGDLPNILLCFKSTKSDKKEKKNAENGGDKGNNKNRKRAKSRELRGGVLYNGCECERRNGLQDQCPRTECQGAPECMTLPPTCLPSEFAQGKHIIKYYAQLKKERDEYARKLKGESAADSGGGKGKDEKVDFDCFPLDQLMKEGMPCPLCDRPMEGATDKVCNSSGKPLDIVIGPLVVSADCLCCPGAS